MASASAPPGQLSPRDVFPRELSHLNGPNFLGVDVLLNMRDHVFWDRQ